MIYGYCTQLDTDAAMHIGNEFVPHDCDRVVVERIQSPSRARSELAGILSACKEGDKIIVRQLSDLSWRLPDLITTLESLSKRGIELVDLSSGLRLQDATAADLCSALAKHSQAVMQLRSVYNHLQTNKPVGRPSEISDEQWKDIKDDLVQGKSVKDAAEKWKVKPQAIYYRRRRDAEEAATSREQDPRQGDIEYYLKLLSQPRNVDSECSTLP